MTYLDELHALVTEWWPLALDKREDFRPFDQPIISSAITELDARSFMRGLHADPPLFKVVDGFKLYSQLLPTLKAGADKQFNLIERQGTVRVTIRDETIVHYGAATELIQDYGWPRDRVVSEPHVGSLTGGPLDLLVYKGNPTDGTVYIGVEAKGDATKLARLVAGINRCEGTTSKGHPPTDHKKCEGLLLFHPEWFWGVAAGPTRDLYRIEYLDATVRLIPVETIDQLDTPDPNP